MLKIWLRRLGIALLLLIVLLAIGRQVQVAWESRVVGERAPYLQMLGPDRVTIRWQSEEPYRGVLRVGPAPGRYEWTLEESEAGERHAVTLTGLEPGTAYFYAVGSEEKVAYTGPSYRFVTAPPSAAKVPVRIWVQGDPGYAVPQALAVRDAAIHWLARHPRPGRTPMDLWLTTGDNAYRSGSNTQFQQHLFEPYAALLRQYAYWPSYGNHDARRRTFFELFDFPANGELGGIPSGSERYYGFDYGPVHLVFLDTQSGDLDRDGDMLQWLEADLSANKATWTLALLHHSPYTKGSHDSDSYLDSWGRMRRARENIVPILERHAVDLVLSGHSHIYERSNLIACHYGDADSFTQAMVVDGEPPYTKAGRGTIYAVVGSSAKLDNGPLNHPAMAVGLHQRGSLMIDINGGQLSAHFINEHGQVSDRFTVDKGAVQVPALPCPERE